MSANPGGESPNVLKKTPLYEMHRQLGARIIDFSMEADHARVKMAELLEVSLTDRPSCPGAVVLQRYPVPATDAFFDAMLRRVAIAQQMTKMLRQEIRKCPA